MNDKELIEKVETLVHFVMLKGCGTDAHLGRTAYDPGSWIVTLRADEMSRLIDLAKAGEQHDL